MPLEIFEGLAEYSGARLAGFSEGEVVKAAVRRRASDPGLVRSFAYVSGPLYGFLLDDTGPDWRKHAAKDVDLGTLLGERSKVSARPVREADRIADRYGGATLRVAEGERERHRAEQIAAWRRSLVDGPVLIVDLKAVTSGSFDPRRVFPVGDKQVVYTSRTLIGPWGTLSVEDGSILEDQTTMLGHVSLAGASADSSRGAGWSLKLDDGWTVGPGTRAGDVVLRRR